MLRRMIKDRRIVQGCRSANFGTSPRSFLAIELLKTRSILKVSGEDASNFMQGLITNDMRHLEDGACSMYTMFLNIKGRVMYDAIIYGRKEDNSFLVECDLSALPALQKHLSLYRVRRKIKIDNLDDNINVWALFNPEVPGQEVSPYTTKENIVGEVTCSVVEDSETVINDFSEPVPVFKGEHYLTVCRDPRIAALGYRILAPKKANMNQIASEEANAKTVTDQGTYRLTRYKLGVGEGVEDLPPGKTFPLEANCDYLHGVSFHKGCYIGQELTARSHHTGVIRKRLMPLDFDSAPTAPFTPDAPIEHGNNCSRPVGKLRGFEQTSGLALLRIAEALDATVMNVLGGTCQTRKPFWWPQEAPKERISIGRDSG